MSGFIDYISNLSIPESETEFLMYNTSLFMLDLVPVEVAVLVNGKVSEVRDGGAISGMVSFDL